MASSRLQEVYEGYWPTWIYACVTDLQSNGVLLSTPESLLPAETCPKGCYTPSNPAEFDQVVTVLCWLWVGSGDSH